MKYTGLLYCLGNGAAVPVDAEVALPKRRRPSAGAFGDYVSFLRKKHRDDVSMQEQRVKLDEAHCEAERKEREARLEMEMKEKEALWPKTEQCSK